MSSEQLSKAKLQYFSKLIQKKHRQSRNELLIEGIRLCNDLLEHSIEFKSIIFSERLQKHPQGQAIIKKAASQKIKTFITNEQSIKKLTSTQTPQSIVACIKKPEETITEDFFKDNRFLVLMDINDPGNVGTLIRSAKAFGWNKIICIGNMVETYSPKVIRASMGAIFHVKIVSMTFESSISHFKNNNISRMFTMPENGQEPPYTDLPKKIALFLGNEAHGLPKSLIPKADKILKLPMSKEVESLNVAVSGGIFLFLLRQY